MSVMAFVTYMEDTTFQNAIMTEEIVAMTHVSQESISARFLLVREVCPQGVPSLNRLGSGKSIHFVRKIRKYT